MSSEQASGPGLRLELCEWAAVNVDGTHTLVRAGLERWHAPLPFNLLVWAFAELPPGFGVGTHPFEAHVVSPEGLPVASVSGSVIAGSERRTMFALPLQASIQAYGSWRVHLTVRGISVVAGLEIARPVNS